MKLNRLTAAGALALGVAAGAAAQAEPVATNAPIIVTASRTGRSADEIAAGVTVITADAIARSGAADVVQALETLGGVYIRKTSGNPSRAEVSLRGFGENSHGRVLVLVNGERLNNLDMSAPDLLRIPFGSIERIEILHGPQAVLYGDSAGAGVINVVTHPGGGAPTTTIGATVGSQHTRGAAVSTAGPLDDTVRYAVDANWLRSDGWRENSDYETRDIRATLNADWKERFSSSLSLFYNQAGYGMPGDLTRAQMRANPKQSDTPRDTFDSESWGLAFGHALLVGEEGRLALDFTASRRLTDSDNDYTAWGYWMYYSGTLDSFTLSPSYSDRYRIAGLDNRLTLGIDARFDTLAMAYTYNPQIPLWGISNKRFDLDRLSLAGYAENETFFSETLSLVLGGRADRIRNEPDVNNAGLRDVASTESALSAALLYRPTRQVKTFARAATLYHAPFADEQVNIWGFPPAVVALEPETGLSFEAGSVARLGERWEAGLTAFQLDLENEIVYNPVAFANQNYDDTRRRGIESSLSWTLPGTARLAAFYTFVEAEFDAGSNAGNDVPLVPRHLLTVNGEWSVVDDVALLGAFRATGSQTHGSDFANAQRSLAGFGVVDLGVRVTPRRVEGLAVTFSVDNVFDKLYAATGFYGTSFYPANGRTWRLTASYTF